MRLQPPVLDWTSRSLLLRPSSRAVVYDWCDDVRLDYRYANLCPYKLLQKCAITVHTCKHTVMRACTYMVPMGTTAYGSALARGYNHAHNGSDGPRLMYIYIFSSCTCLTLSRFSICQRLKLLGNVHDRHICHASGIQMPADYGRQSHRSAGCF